MRTLREELMPSQCSYHFGMCWSIWWRVLFWGCFQYRIATSSAFIEGRAKTSMIVEPITLWWPFVDAYLILSSDAWYHLVPAVLSNFASIWQMRSFSSISIRYIYGSFLFHTRRPLLFLIILYNLWCKSFFCAACFQNGARRIYKRRNRLELHWVRW